MKTHFFRAFSALMAVMLVCMAFVSCTENDSETKRDAQTSAQIAEDGVGTDAATDAKTPEEEPVPTLRYGMSNGQWGQLARYEYNSRGQLLSVTTVSPFTLAPMCYETNKSDRVFVYGGGDRMTRVWLSYGYAFDLNYSADGLTAEGSCQKDGYTYTAKLTLSDKGILLKEEYASPYNTTVYEYDADGRVVTVTQSNGFVTTHTYSDNEVKMTLKKTDGQKMADYTFTVEGEKITGLVSDGVSVRYTYENDLLTKSEYDGSVCTLKYDGEGRVVTTEADGSYKVTESFEYGTDGKISKYIRERKTSLSARWEHEKVTLTYAYASDGTVSKLTHELVTYDNNGNETYRRTTEY